LKEKSLTHNGTEYPYVFYHYSGFNISNQKGKLLVKIFYYVPDVLRKYLLQPYIDLMMTVYSAYLHENISVVVIDDQVKGFSRFCFIIIQHISHTYTWNKFHAWFLERKYSERHTPYSENKK